MKGWTGKFGDTQTLPLLPYQPDPRQGGMTLVEIHGTEPTSVCIGLSMEDGGAVTPGAEILAYVQWGIGGGSASAVIDFVNGASFNLLADFVRVTAAQRLLHGAGAPAVGNRVTVSGIAAPGVCLPTSKPQRTIRNLNNLVAGVGITDLVPRYAKTMKLSCVPYTSVALVEFGDFVGGEISEQYLVTAFPSRDLPVPNHMAWGVIGAAPVPLWRLTNNAVKDTITSYTAVFDLAL